MIDSAPLKKKPVRKFIKDHAIPLTAATVTTLGSFAIQIYYRDAHLKLAMNAVGAYGDSVRDALEQTIILVGEALNNPPAK